MFIPSHRSRSTLHRLVRATAKQTQRSLLRASRSALGRRLPPHPTPPNTPRNPSSRTNTPQPTHASLSSSPYPSRASAPSTRAGAAHRAPAPVPTARNPLSRGPTARTAYRREISPSSRRTSSATRTRALGRAARASRRPSSSANAAQLSRAFKSNRGPFYTGSRLRPKALAPVASSASIARTVAKVREEIDRGAREACAGVNA